MWMSEAADQAGVNDKGDTLECPMIEALETEGKR